MAYLRFALYFANSYLENLLPDLVARHYLFRALVLDGFKFNKTQVFALFPSSVDFLSHVSTRSCYYVKSLQQSASVAAA
jgi:hypothetical protein